MNYKIFKTDTYKYTLFIIINYFIIKYNNFAFFIFYNIINCINI